MYNASKKKFGAEIKESDDSADEDDNDEDSDDENAVRRRQAKYNEEDAELAR